MLLAGLALILPTWWMARRHGFGAAPDDEPRPPFWASFKDAFLGLFVKVLILGGLRFGWFTPSEAAVVAVAYGLFLGIVVYRTLGLGDIYRMMVESAEIWAVILTLVAVIAWPQLALWLPHVLGFN